MEELDLVIPRWHRWISASHVASSYVPAMMKTLQGLGRLDHDLHAYDQQLVQAGFSSSREADTSTDYQITLSYLWVLGAYEVLRSIKQRVLERKKTDSALMELYGLFTRVRIPLAKFEAARTHKKTDANIAVPVHSLSHGIGWQVSSDVFITRGELSDAFLLWLESKRTSEQGDS